jgi:hypothetical protein
MSVMGRKGAVFMRVDIVAEVNPLQWDASPKTWVASTERGDKSELEHEVCILHQQTDSWDGARCEEPADRSAVYPAEASYNRTYRQTSIHRLRRAAWNGIMDTGKRLIRGV